MICCSLLCYLPRADFSARGTPLLEKRDFFFPNSLFYVILKKRGVKQMRDFDWYILSSLHKTKNITQSAKLLFIEQPTLTRRLQAMEKELGCTLVYRTTKGIEFTAQGEKVVRRAEVIVQLLQSIEKDIRHYDGGEEGTLTIGAPYSYARFLLPRLLKGFAAECPKIDVDVVTSSSSELYQHVQSGLLDLCFTRSPEPDENLCSRLVNTEACYAVYSQPFVMEDLPGLPYIEYDKNEATNQAVRRWWLEHFSQVQNVRYKVENGDICLSFIQQGLGYGIFPSGSYFLHDKSLYSRPLVFQDGSAFSRKTYLVYPANSEEMPVLSRFLRFVEDFPFPQA